MSLNTSTNSLKQRKLSDLRVIDLQRELRSVGVSYDKKELKGSLVEKLRQALIHRNVDPDAHLFDTSADLKSISSDENNRNHEENGSQEALHSDTLIDDADDQMKMENSVKTMPAASSTTTSLTNDMDDDSCKQTNGLSTIDLRQFVEDRDNDNMFLTIDHLSSHNEDENNNDKLTIHGYSHRSASPSDLELDTHHSRESFNDIDNPHTNSSSNTMSTAEDDHQQNNSTTERTTDDANLFKSDVNQSQTSSEQAKKENNQKSNRDQCHLWVSNIAKETHASDLKELFSKYGKVLTTKVIGSSSSQWFGYITLATPDDVEKCIAALHQTELHGKKIHVDREMYEDKSQSSSSKEKTHTSEKPKSSSRETSRRYDSMNDPKHSSSKKRPASTSNETKKKLSTADLHRSHPRDDKAPRSYETDSSTRKSDDTRRNSSASRHQPEPSRSYRRPDEKSSRSKTSTSTSLSQRSRSKEKLPSSSSAGSHRHRSSSVEKSKDHHRSATSNTYDSTRRPPFHDEQRLRHEKEILERKQYAQHQEEEKIKEQQRRLAEERERVKREFEILERERLEIERTRLALEKEKQEQARELEKQQRRLADEAKQRQQQLEAKLRDEKLHRLAHSDNKRSRGHHSNTNDNSSSHNSSNKGYDYRSSTSSTSDRGRRRSIDDNDRNYYPEPKRPYPSGANNQRDSSFRDRVSYRDSDLPMLSSSVGSNNNQRYHPSNSNQHRPSDPYGNLPARGRDMALPPTSSVSTAYERSSRNAVSPPPNVGSMSRRANSREQFDNRDYLHETDRRDRSPPNSNKLRREPMEPAHWERPKLRDAAHYPTEPHKYLPNQYHSESSSQSNQQQGLWSSAPPSRQAHHHPDLTVKLDAYGWQQVSQPPPPPPSSSHDRSRNNLSNNQRLAMLPSNQPPPPPPPSSSRGGASSQSHLYNHPGVPMGPLSSSQQQHVPMAPPPSSLHHTSAYITQSVPPTGLVLHSTGQTRAYEPHYVVTQPLPLQRRY